MEIEAKLRAAAAVTSDPASRALLEDAAKEIERLRADLILIQRAGETVQTELAKIERLVADFLTHQALGRS